MKALKYDVALSYASEDRSYVSKVARALRAAGVKVFYDEFERANLWGKNLYRHLSNVFKNEARYCVIFVSRSFAKKPWTRKEMDAAFARALTEGEYVLPARFDETEIPGLEETIAYQDLRTTQPEELANLILQKLAGTFTLQDVVQFYDLWHASVPTEAVVDRIRDRLQRAGGSPSEEGIEFQARLSTALAEQYLKQRKVELGREALEHAQDLARSSGKEDDSAVLQQVVMDCKWLSLIVARFEGDALGCVRGCEEEIKAIDAAIRKRPVEPFRSQLILHRYRIRRSLITYYYIAGKLPASLALADALFLSTQRPDRFDWRSIDVGALAEAHLLTGSVMQRLLVYERFQVARRILSAYLHVGDLYRAANSYTEFGRCYLAVVEGGAVDTLSVTIFHKLTGNLAALLSMGDNSDRGKSLTQLARGSFMISRLGAVQQQLPTEYRERGILERVMVPAIDFASLQASPRSKADQLVSARKAQEVLTASKVKVGLNAAVYYPSGGSAAVDRVAVLLGGNAHILAAAHFAGNRVKEVDPGRLRGLCEQLLLSAGALTAQPAYGRSTSQAFAQALAAAGVEPAAELALFLGVLDRARKVMVVLAHGHVRAYAGRSVITEVTPITVVLHRINFEKQTLIIALNAPRGSSLMELRNKALSGECCCLKIGER